MGKEGLHSLSLNRAEAGATVESLKATETVVDLLQGFELRLALSILTNATALVLCHVCPTETKALEESRAFKKQVDRCIETNFHNLKEGRNDQSRS